MNTALGNEMMDKARPINQIRRRLIVGSAACTVAGPLRAIAQGISKRPVRIIVPQSPGTTPDSIARLLAPKLQERWGQSFVVENRFGASGAIGMEFVAKAVPDGDTIMVNVASTVTLPLFKANLPFDVLKSFQPISLVGANTFALVVHSSVPVNNAQEFIAYVRARPGRLNYGSPGVGTFHNLVMELLKLTEGLDIVHVPYKGSSAALTDLIGGHIATMFMPLHIAVPLHKEGKIEILGASLATGDPLYPEIPSLFDQGMRGIDLDVWYAVWGPAGMSADVVVKYNTALRDIVSSPDMSEALAKLGLTAKSSSPEELTRVAAVEANRWTRVIRKIKNTTE